MSCPNATVGAITSVDGNNKYKFKLTPTTSSTNQITMTNARDINSFIYPSFSTLANLKFSLFFSYSTISGLVSRFDASVAGSYTVDGSLVSTWKDTVGTSVMAQSGTNKPTLTTQNGLNAVRFNASTSTLLLPTTTQQLSVGTWIIVYNNTSTASYATPFTCMAFPSNTPGFAHGGSTNMLFYSDGDFPQGNVRINRVPLSTPLTALRSLVANVSVESHTFTSIYNNMTFRLMGANSFDTTRAMTGSICELLFYNRILSTSEVDTIETYLMNKWGVV
jgi:hypothetical protein